MNRTEWALVAVGLLGFGLAALGHHALGQCWLTGAGFLMAAAACIALVVVVPSRPSALLPRATTAYRAAN